MGRQSDKPSEAWTEGTDPMQGEGDKASAKRYDEATREFVESGRVDESAERARGQDPKEAEQAERAGRERAKEQDPAVHRDYDKPTRN